MPLEIVKNRSYVGRIAHFVTHRVILSDTAPRLTAKMCSGIVEVSVVFATTLFVPIVYMILYNMMCGIYVCLSGKNFMELYEIYIVYIIFL